MRTRICSGQMDRQWAHLVDSGVDALWSAAGNGREGSSNACSSGVNGQLKVINASINLDRHDQAALWISCGWVVDDPSRPPGITDSDEGKVHPFG